MFERQTNGNVNQSSKNTGNSSKSGKIKFFFSRECLSLVHLFGGHQTWNRTKKWMTHHREFGVHSFKPEILSFWARFHLQIRCHQGSILCLSLLQRMEPKLYQRVCTKDNYCWQFALCIRVVLYMVSER